MKPEIQTESIQQILAAQGVATESARAQSYAAAITQVLSLAAPGFAQSAFEDEPANYVAEQRRNAP